MNNYPILCKKCQNHLFVFIADDPYKGRLTDFTIICHKCGTQYARIDQIAKDIEGSKDSEGSAKQ